MDALALASVALLVAAFAFWRMILREREMNSLIEAYHVLDERFDRLRRFVQRNSLWADTDFEVSDELVRRREARRKLPT